jgi:dTDP-4-amino-4,6-dideoxygalactose transaminase
MQIVSYPPALIEAHVAELRALLERGEVAEGRYLRDEGPVRFVANRASIPVASGGAGLFALLAHHRHVGGKRRAIVQSNTMRALYTVPRLLELEVSVVPSSYADFMAMSPGPLDVLLGDPAVAREAVVVYSVIGGYLAPSFAEVRAICVRRGVPLVVDGAHAHYLDAVAQAHDVDIAYSFYATKILPAGEGGLIVTSNAERLGWLRRFLIYDRFKNELDVGLNLRASELSAALMHRLMTERSLVEHFRDKRVALARGYAAVAREQGLAYLDPERAADYNGYKLVVLDPHARVAELHTSLTEHKPTSGVFDTDVLGRPTALPHWCPPTYSSLAPGGRP